jgi:uncharacterized protein (DUF433 family)
MTANTDRERFASIECKEFRRTVARNLAAFRWGRRRVVSIPDVLGGEPVFRGTRIPLQHVASLFRKGVPEKEIAEDFPALRVIWHMLACPPASVKGLAGRERDWPFDGDRPYSDATAAG